MVTPIRSSTHASQPPLTLKIKTKPGMKSITILGDDSNGSSPIQAMPYRTLTWNSHVLDVPRAI